MDRRLLLSSFGSSFFWNVGGLSAQTPGARPGLRRLQIETFAKDASLVAALRAAFTIMQKRPKSDLLSAFNYAAIHGTPAKDANADGLPAEQEIYWGQCHRDEDLFFIWHRNYLKSVERNLQILSGRSDLGLPYWDWYSSPALPEIFRVEFLDQAKTQRNSLYDSRRDDAVQNGASVWKAGSSGALDQAEFFRFQRDLNGSEHSDIHMGIGGNMGAVPTAARDPIFWLHHCNIDRLLAAWVNHGGQIVDQSGVFDNHYKFPIQALPDLVPLAAMSDMANPVPFGVAYESLAVPFAQAPSPIARPPVTQIRGASTRKIGPQTFAFDLPQSTSVSSQGLSVRFTRPARSDRTMISILSSQPLEAATSLTVVLDGVRIGAPSRGLSGYDIYLNLPDGTTTDPRLFKIVSIPLFALTVEPMTDMSMTQNFRFPLLGSLKANGGLGSSLVISLVPRIAPYGDQVSLAIGLTMDDLRIEASLEATM
jgi:tyrosinase